MLGAVMPVEIMAAMATATATATATMMPKVI